MTSEPRPFAWIFGCGLVADTEEYKDELEATTDLGEAVACYSQHTVDMMEAEVERIREALTRPIHLLDSGLKVALRENGQDSYVVDRIVEALKDIRHALEGDR